MSHMAYVSIEEDLCENQTKRQKSQMKFLIHIISKVKRLSRNIDEPTQRACVSRWQDMGGEL